MNYYQDHGRILKHQITPEGLRVWLTVSRVGDLTYYKDGQPQIQSVTASTLYDQDSLDTAWGKPITSDHPPEPVSMENSTKYQAGMTLNSFVLDNGFLTTVAVITDRNLVDSVINGEKNQVSAAYTADLVEKDGHLEQTNRRYNHFAIVRRGRAGADVKVHLSDSYQKSDDVWHTDIDQLPELEMTDNLTQSQLTQVEIDGVKYDSSEDLAKAIVSLQNSIRDSKAKSELLTGKLTALEITKDTYDQAPDYKGYFEIRTLAAMNQDSYDPEFKKSIPEMKIDILRSRLSEDQIKLLNLDAWSSDYIDGVLQGVLASQPKRVTPSESLKMVMVQDQSPKLDDMEAIRIKYATAISQNGKA